MSMVSRYQKRIPSTGPSATLRTNSGHVRSPAGPHRPTVWPHQSSPRGNRLGSRTKGSPMSVWASHWPCCHRDQAQNRHGWRPARSTSASDSKAAATYCQCHILAWARVGPAEVREHCPVDDVRARPRHGRRNLRQAAVQQLHMSARCLRDSRRVPGILKLSRTIAGPSADPGQARREPTRLAGSGGIETAHLAEAVQYQPRRQT